MKSLGNKHEVIMTCELLCYWVEYNWKSQSKYKIPMNFINSLIGILRYRINVHLYRTIEYRSSN